jgi:hypothetical protein
MRAYIILLPILLLCACREERVPFYNEPADRLSFTFSDAHADSVTYHTFAYLPATTLEDTVWLDVFTTGFITAYPRPVTLCQLPVDTLAAMPGLHYVPFDDPRVRDLHVVPAGANAARLPLIVKRDPSLQAADVSLTIGIVENDFFRHGFVNAIRKRVVISDVLVKPASWSRVIDIMFSPYGRAKHRFMVTAAAPLGIVVDDDFVSANITLSDLGLLNYWKRFFQAKLAEENERRATLGLAPLREDPAPGQAEGELVTF